MNFKGKVVLITGAANGFGKEFVKEAAARGMKIAAVDIEEKELEDVANLAKEAGAEILTLRCDVTVYDEVEVTVNRVMEHFGRIDMLMNNAGIALMGPVWERPIRDAEWITKANYLSHVYFMHIIIPIMIKQQTHCYICNTCSTAGLMTFDGMPLYFATKNAAVALAESTYYDLQEKGADIGMSIYCPGFVQTDLHNCERHRPVQYTDNSDEYYSSAAFDAAQKKAEHLITTGFPIDTVRDEVFGAIEREEFYIITQKQYEPIIGGRVKMMLSGMNPDIDVIHGKKTPDFGK